MNDEAERLRETLAYWEGIEQAVTGWDRLSAVIRACRDREDAVDQVARVFGVSETQALIMVDVQVGRLTTDTLVMVREQLAQCRDRLRSFDDSA
ncbi:MAG: hypothetical protein QM597_04445 [Aeromicrobium sp.]|uniref:hypothetical protein n=1 Tax=Aeromicrobium sp. TaxID=1871063 RepID=UPI0039E6739B